MKRALLIAGGTVGGLGAVLAITPPQLGSTSAINIAGGSIAGPDTTAVASASSSSAATASSTKATATKSAKPVATKKATAKATAKASAKPKPTKKKVVKKKKKRAKVRITPSPKPVWPPKGFSVEGEVYAKVPTAKELVGLISANKVLEKRIKECSTYICGSVQVASEIGCVWWEVISAVTDGQGAKLGELTSAFGSSEPKEFKTLIIVSPESADQGGAAKIVSVICHHEDRVTNDPTNNYKKTA